MSRLIVYEDDTNSRPIALVKDKISCIEDLALKKIETSDLAKAEWHFGEKFEIDPSYCQFLDPPYEVKIICWPLIEPIIGWIDGTHFILSKWVKIIDFGQEKADSEEISFRYNNDLRMFVTRKSPPIEYTPAYLLLRDMLCKFSGLPVDEAEKKLPTEVSVVYSSMGAIGVLINERFYRTPCGFKAERANLFVLENHVMGSVNNTRYFEIGCEIDGDGEKIKTNCEAQFGGKRFLPKFWIHEYKVLVENGGVSFLRYEGEFNPMFLAYLHWEESKEVDSWFVRENAAKSPRVRFGTWEGHNLALFESSLIILSHETWKCIRTESGEFLACDLGKTELVPAEKQSICRHRKDVMFASLSDEVDEANLIGLIFEYMVDSFVEDTEFVAGGFGL
jgi:hypothetical protein